MPVAITTIYMQYLRNDNLHKNYSKKFLTFITNKIFPLVRFSCHYMLLQHYMHKYDERGNKYISQLYDCIFIHICTQKGKVKCHCIIKQKQVTAMLIRHQPNRASIKTVLQCAAPHLLPDNFSHPATCHWLLMKTPHPTAARWRLCVGCTCYQDNCP